MWKCPYQKFNSTWVSRKWTRPGAFFLDLCGSWITRLRKNSIYLTGHNLDYQECFLFFFFIFFFSLYHLECWTFCRCCEGASFSTFFFRDTVLCIYSICGNYDVHCCRTHVLPGEICKCNNSSGVWLSYLIS